MSYDQALDKLSEKLNSRLLVQEEHGFQKGAQSAPWPEEQKKSLAWIGLNADFWPNLVKIRPLKFETVAGEGDGW